VREKLLSFFCHLKIINLHIMANTNFIPFNQSPADLALKPPNFYQPTQDPEIDKVMSVLESEPINTPFIAPTTNIPALREQLAVLVSTGRCKEAIGKSLSQEDVRRLDEKEVLNLYKRYETYVGSKTTDTLIDNFLSLAIKGVGMIVEIDDADALKNELKGDFIISKEMSQFCGGLALKFGSTLAAVNATAITAKHVNFSQVTEQIAEQYPVITEELPNNSEELLN